jgi:hypothetical protein
MRTKESTREMKEVVKEWTFGKIKSREGYGVATIGWGGVSVGGA